MCFSEPILSGMLPIQIAEIDGRKWHGSISGIVNGTGSFGGLLILPLATWIGESDYLYALLTICIALGLSAVLCVIVEKQTKATKT